MINAGMQLQQGQKLEQNLSQQMIQSLQILQLPTLELEARIRDELENNPLLEIDESAQEEERFDERSDSEEESFDESSSIEESVDWENFSEQQGEESRGGKGSSSGDLLQAEIPYSAGVEELLLLQLGEQNLSSAVLEIARYLVQNLDDNGWLRFEEESWEGRPPMERTPWMEEADLLISGELSEEECSADLRSALQVVQSLEPAGIGARDLRESLLLQARRLTVSTPLVISILEEAFDLLERRLVPALAKKFSVAPSEIQEALEAIARLNPYPGRILDSTPEMTIAPDAMVFWREGRVQIILNDGHLPPLRVNSTYQALLGPSSGATGEEKKYVRDRFDKAQWLIRAVDQRKKTILKVIRTIVRRQLGFFEAGSSQLKPMTLQDVADEIDMHLSTVNRVTNGKYIQTDHGLFELKSLFTAGVVQEDGSEESGAAIRQRILSLIEGEPPSKPLSDQALVDALTLEGLKVARRTVTKYREQLGISVARMRKKF